MKIKIGHVYIYTRSFIYQFVSYDEFYRLFSQLSNSCPLERCDNTVAPSIVWPVEGREVWWPKNWTFSCYATIDYHSKWSSQCFSLLKSPLGMTLKLDHLAWSTIFCKTWVSQVSEVLLYFSIHFFWDYSPFGICFSYSKDKAQGIV